MSTSECTSNDDACRNGVQAAWVSATSTSLIFVGSVIGQTVMGYAGDVMGRNEAALLTIALATIGALGSAWLSVGSSASVYAIIIVFRFILGIGAGGMYPLSAIKAAEDAVTEQAKSQHDESHIDTDPETVRCETKSDHNDNHSYLYPNTTLSSVKQKQQLHHGHHRRHHQTQPHQNKHHN